MANRISILIQAQDAASATIKKVGDNIDGAAGQSQRAEGKFQSVNARLTSLAALSASAGVGLHSMSGVMGDSVAAANKYQNALAGLTSIANHFNVDANKAKQAAQTLAADGLMTVTEAATGLKNLLASGFSLPQAINLMDRFKDSASFNRQAALGFGEAIAGATEGIKNGNSILVDNAGVTKNLSVILKEAGFSAQDLMNATSDASIRQAIYNGILKETAPMVGDAKRLSEQYAGEQAKLNAQITVAQQRLGTALQPALLATISVITPLVQAVGEWVEKNPQLASGIVMVTGTFLALLAGLGLVGAAVMVLTPAFELLGLKAAGSAILAGGAWVVQAGLASAAWTAQAIPAMIASTASLGASLVAFGGFAALAAAAIAAFIIIQQKFEETKAVVRASAREVASSRAEGEKTDAFMKRMLEEGRISNEKYQSYLRNTQNAAEEARNNMYSGFFGPLNKSFDNLFARITGTKDKFKGTGFGGFASGTNYAPGGLTWVGEHGPELMNVPRGAQITPAYRSRSEGVASGGHTVHVENININNGGDYHRMLTDIGFALELSS